MPKRIVWGLLLMSGVTPASADGVYRKLAELASNPPATICHYTTRAFNWVGERLAGDSFAGRRSCPLDGQGCVDGSQAAASAPGSPVADRHSPQGQFRDSLRASLGPSDFYFELSGDDVFASGGARPAPSAVVRIERSLAAVDPQHVRRIEVIGHSDARGRADYNLDLSRRRAESVAQIIAARLAVDSSLLVPVGAGEGHPVAPNRRADGADDPQGRALNRRVDVVIRGG